MIVPTNNYNALKNSRVGTLRIMLTSHGESELKKSESLPLWDASTDDKYKAIYGTSTNLRGLPCGVVMWFLSGELLNVKRLLSTHYPDGTEKPYTLSVNDIRELKKYRSWVKRKIKKLKQEN